MNKHIVTGNLVADAETRELQSGKVVTTFRMASNEHFGQQTQTDFHKCEIWGSRGQNLQKYLVKGQEVLVEGRHTYPTSQRQDGSTFYDSKIVVRDIELLRRPNKQE